MSDEVFQPGGDRFPPTRRTVIEAVGSLDAEERERALESLCAAYWRPIYKYIRLRWNRPAEEAQDLTPPRFQRQFAGVYRNQRARRLGRGRLRNPATG